MLLDLYCKLFIGAFPIVGGDVCEGGGWVCANSFIHFRHIAYTCPILYVFCCSSLLYVVVQHLVDYLQHLI